MSRRLVKSSGNKMLFGVAGGLAEYLDLDPALVRVGFVVLCFASGIGLLAYTALAVLMPSPDKAIGWAPPAASQKEQSSSVEESGSHVGKEGGGVNSRRNAVGLILVGIGIFFLIANFNLIPFGWGLVWPLILVGIGAALLAGRRRGA